MLIQKFQSKFRELSIFRCFSDFMGKISEGNQPRYYPLGLRLVGRRLKSCWLLWNPKLYPCLLFMLLMCNKKVTQNSYQHWGVKMFYKLPYHFKDLKQTKINIGMKNILLDAIQGVPKLNV